MMEIYNGRLPSVEHSTPHMSPTKTGAIMSDLDAENLAFGMSHTGDQVFTNVSSFILLNKIVILAAFL
jgi:hypothetical protein